MSSVVDESRRCFKCGYETVSALAQCPTCGGAMRTGKSVRRLGWVLLAIGAILVVSMGVITINVAELVYHSGEPGATSEFTGGPDMATFMFGIFGLVLLFGVASMASGIWQIK
jgi:hypothetical protein